MASPVRGPAAKADAKLVLCGLSTGRRCSIFIAPHATCLGEIGIFTSTPGLSPRTTRHAQSNTPSFSFGCMRRYSPALLPLVILARAWLPRRCRVAAVCSRGIRDPPPPASRSPSHQVLSAVGPSVLLSVSTISVQLHDVIRSHLIMVSAGALVGRRRRRCRAFSSALLDGSGDHQRHVFEWRQDRRPALLRSLSPPCCPCYHNEMLCSALPPGAGPGFPLCLRRSGTRTVT